MGGGIYDFEGKRRERKDGDNLHGAIALPTTRLLKVRLMNRTKTQPHFGCVW
jgi:hypothetical protein